MVLDKQKRLDRDIHTYPSSHTYEKRSDHLPGSWVGSRLEEVYGKLSQFRVPCCCGVWHLQSRLWKILWPWRFGGTIFGGWSWRKEKAKYPYPPLLYRCIWCCFFSGYYDVRGQPNSIQSGYFWKDFRENPSTMIHSFMFFFRIEVI